jgi:V/A-type H+/Na+-transporting ATPase subunit I
VSIVRLMKVTLIGCVPDKLTVLNRLQDMGCLHIIPLAGNQPSDVDHSASAREALRFLSSTPRKFKQVTNDSQFDAAQVERDVLALRDQLDAFTQERDKLRTYIEQRRAWGNFKPPIALELRGQRLWLYCVPLFQLKEVESSGLNWIAAGRDNRFVYVAVISEQEPPPGALPVPALPNDERSLNELEERLENVELAIADAEIERQRQSRWCLLLLKSLNRIDDKVALEYASTQTYNADPVFAFQAWVPHDRHMELQVFAAEHALCFNSGPPDPSENPPTKLCNPEHIAGGEELVSLYMTPGYWLSDPSTVVFFSFALFFAMIVADAGYGLLLSLTSLALYGRLGATSTSRRWRLVMVWVSGLSIIYGVLVGSYFGVAPRSDFLKSLNVVDMKNYGQMMLLSAMIGAGHVILANLMNAWRYGRDLRALAPFGWAMMVLGGMTLAISSKYQVANASQFGAAAIAAGILLVISFTAPRETLGKRLLGGLLGLTKITSAFGDVLSYLRLFALGLASASLATVFNGMAERLYQHRSGLGILFAILILAFGHAVNLILSVSSGFIHGLRLNVIEFFNWGVQEEGKAYRPFMRKEM